MRSFNIKIANRWATVSVKYPQLYGEYPETKIIIRHYWSQMSPEKSMRIVTNSINIKALKKALIARRIRLELNMHKINSITKNNFIIIDNAIVW